MKKNHLLKTLTLYCFLTYIFFMPTIQAQHLENSTTRPENKDFRYYSKKQKNQKTTAWILLTGGAVLSVSGMIVQAAEATTDLVTIMAGAEPEEFSQTGTYVSYAGLATMATSIPFFIASGKNKKRANISLQQQKITMGNKISQQTNYHSISLNISLGK